MKSIFVSIELGEPIYISFHLDNRSTKTIRFLPQLIQKTSFKDYYQVFDSEKLMATNYAELCVEGCSQSDIICIPIPYDAISSIATDLLEINYYIKLFVDVSGGAEHFDSIPVFIK